MLKGALSGLRQFLATESPLKVMKKAFYFTKKLFSFSRYFSFYLDFLVLYQNGLIKKMRLISNFWRKIFLLLYSINWPNFIFWLPLLFDIFGNICIAIVCKPGCDVMNFEVKFIFLIKPFFLHDQKVVTKT